MKKLLLVLSLFFTALCSYAQEFNALQNVVYKEKTEYKEYQPQIQECANYILSVPVQADNENRAAALRSLIVWMTGTPDHKFIVDETATRLMDKNDAVLGLYLAAMTKFVLENTDKAADANEVKYGAVVTLLDYCASPTNNVPLTKELKRALAQKNKGKLREYLKI